MDERQLTAKVAAVLDRWPSAGLAAGVVRNGSLQWFLGHGVADIASRTPVTPDTVFRIGSVTKTMTAVAVMQLTEQGSSTSTQPPVTTCSPSSWSPPRRASDRSRSVTC